MSVVTRVLARCRSVPLFAMMFAFLTAFISMPALVLAQQATESSARVTKSDIEIVIQPDGTYTRTTDVILTALDKTAISTIGTARLPFNASLQELEVLEAATIKANGQRIPVDASAITTQAAPNVNSLTITQDLKTQTIVFPNLDAGDSVAFKTRLLQKTADFPGHYALAQFYPINFSWASARLKVSAPQSFKLNIEATGVEGGVVAQEGGNQTWLWTYHNTKTTPYESGTVSTFSYTPHVFISSFSNYGELAAAYRARAHDKAAITPAIQKLADELTAGVPDRADQAKRLYNWVAKNIRYVAIYLDVGGFVPHQAEAVLNNRYGDCKDHVVLLEALLAAKGIPSSAVLISTLNNYSLPQVALPQMFNHAISFVPELNLYLDSTNPFTPFGILPFEDAGKQVLAVNEGGLQRTPPTRVENFSWTRSTLSYDTDGAVDGSLNMDTRGQVAITMRQMENGIQKDKEDEFIRQLFANSGLSGVQGTLQKLENTSDNTNRLVLKYSGKNALNFSTAGAFYVTPVMGNGLSLAGVLRTQVVPERKYDYACNARTVQEDFEIRLPSNVQILAIPKNASYEMEDANYQSSYVQDGNKITVMRRLVSRLKSNVCDPAYYVLQKKMNEAVIADLKAQVLFMPH